MSKIEGQEELERIGKGLNEWIKYVESLNGTKIDPSQIGMRSGSILHPDEASAKEERDNPEASAFEASLINKLDSMLGK